MSEFERKSEQVMLPIDPEHAAVLAQIARPIADNRVVILQPNDPDDEGGRVVGPNFRPGVTKR